MNKDKEKQQAALNAKRRLRSKQIAQLRASNEMLEAAKGDVVERYGEGSDTANDILGDISLAQEQNLERAHSYLGANQSEVESTPYNKVSPEEEKAYYDRLKRLGKSDEELHQKDLTKGGIKSTKTKAIVGNKTKSKLAELSERLKSLNNKSNNSQSEDKDSIEMVEIDEEIIKATGPTKEIKKLDKIEHTFEDEYVFETPTENEGPVVKEAVTKTNDNIKQFEEQKECKDFDPRDVPSYIQYDIIPLPSKGECYAHKKGKIPVAYLTAADENLITSRNMYESGSMIDIILERKILDKSIKVSDLCKGDRDAIAIWLRATAYGVDYPIVATYKGEEIESSIDLSEINFIEFNLKGDENGYFDYTTSNGDKIKFKVLSYGEQKGILNKNNSTSEIINRSNIVNHMNDSIELVNKIDAGNKEEIVEALNLIKKWANVFENNEELKDTAYLTFLTDTMYAQTMSVNGITDREYIKNYVDNMRANEALNYRKYINDHVPGVDLNVTVPIPESMGGGSFETFLSIGETIFINV